MNSMSIEEDEISDESPIRSPNTGSIHSCRTHGVAAVTTVQYRQRRYALASLLLTALLLPSCVTASVWGGGVKKDEDGSKSLRFSGDPPFSSSPCINALATPLAVAIDICTLPIQVWFFGRRNDD